MKIPAIGIVSPAGHVTDPAALDRAIHWLEANGHRVVVDEAVLARDMRFAGTDQVRVASLHRMFERDDVDIVMAARGGYGLARLLDRIDHDLIARSGKIFCGHSDCTALQMSLLARSTPTLAGPTVCHDFGPDPALGVSPFMLEHWRAALSGAAYRIDPVATADAPPPCDVTGVLWGGNLCTLVHLTGTPYLPKVEGGILFLEDVYEHPYRIERMLLQLHYAGVLDAQSAILLGSFNGYRLLDNDAGYDLDRAIDFIRGRTRTPILTGLPFGHIRDKASLAVGGMATVTSGAHHAYSRDGAHPDSPAWSLTVTPPAASWNASGAAPFSIRDASWGVDREALRHVRRVVFIEEQNIPEALEWDDADPVSLHALVTDDEGRPIATGRLLADGHIGRIAVVREWRGRGVGAALFGHLVATAEKRGHRALFLNAQTQVADFYARWGFVSVGDAFEEAGIPHIAMERRRS